jgi:hypothetical protein
MNLTEISIASITLESTDPVAAEAFYTKAFALGDRLRFSASDAPTSGFRAYTLSLVVSQPSTVDSLLGTAIEAGATVIKPAKKGLWGYGGVVQAPDGAIWKVATSSKKETGPATREVDGVVLLIGAEDVAASKQFYVEHGLTVARSFGRKYVEFAAPPNSVKLALYGHSALAKDAGVPADGSGSHRLTISSETEPFTDPDGFTWQPASN